MAPGPRSGALPDDMIDHGDHLELRAAGSRLGTVVALVVAAGGLAIALGAPGDLADAPLARFAIGGAMVVAGLVTAVLRHRRVRVDVDGARLEQPLGGRELAWTQIDELGLDEVWARPPAASRASSDP
jgi:hypothetical protein